MFWRIRVTSSIILALLTEFHRHPQQSRETSQTLLATLLPLLLPNFLEWEGYTASFLSDFPLALLFLPQCSVETIFTKDQRQLLSARRESRFSILMLLAGRASGTALPCFSYLLSIQICLDKATFATYHLLYRVVFKRTVQLLWTLPMTPQFKYRPRK